MSSTSGETSRLSSSSKTQELGWFELPRDPLRGVAAPRGVFDSLPTQAVLIAGDDGMKGSAGAAACELLALALVFALETLHTVANTRLFTKRC